MKKGWPLILVSIALTLSVFLSAGGNSFAAELEGEQLLTNPGFEDTYLLVTIISAYKDWEVVNNIVPSRWPGLPNASAKIEVINDPTSAHSGSKYVRLSSKIAGKAGNAEIFSDNLFAADPDKAFEISLWARGKGQATIQVYEYFREGGLCGYNVIPLFDLTPEWKKYQGIWTPTEKCKQIRVVPTIRGEGTVADFDDVEMLKVPAGAGISKSHSGEEAVADVADVSIVKVPEDLSKSKNIQVIDLIEMAPRARWLTTAGEVSFGNDQNELFIVDYRYNTELTDKKVYPRTLYTPVAGHLGAMPIRGQYTLQLPKAGKIVFMASAGGLDGAGKVQLTRLTAPGRKGIGQGSGCSGRDTLAGKTDNLLTVLPVL